MVVGGLLTVLTYILVLQAFSMACVSYGGAIHEDYFVFAAFIGWRWLGEDLGAARIVDAALMFGGIMVIAVAGKPTRVPANGLGSTEKRRKRM